MSILIVDDEQDIRELIGDILRDEGYITRLAANADDCMAEIRLPRTARKRPRTHIPLKAAPPTKEAKA